PRAEGLADSSLLAGDESLRARRASPLLQLGVDALRSAQARAAARRPTATVVSVRHGRRRPDGPRRAKPRRPAGHAAHLDRTGPARRAGAARKAGAGDRSGGSAWLYQ